MTTPTAALKLFAQEREPFEAWIRDRMDRLSLERSIGEDQGYVMNRTNLMWSAWQARAALDKAGDAWKPDIDDMAALMRKAQAIAPNLTTIEPIALTPVQVAWIVGKIHPAPQASADARDAAAARYAFLRAKSEQHYFSARDPAFGYAFKQIDGKALDKYIEQAIAALQRKEG